MKSRSFWSIGAILISSFCAAQEGEMTQYHHANGQVSSEGMLVNGQPEGYWKTYDDAGVLRSEGGRSQHKLDSLWKFYDATGTIENSINYKSGKKEGPSIGFKEGIRSVETPYVDDVKNGAELFYFPSGIIQKRINYEEGKEQGKAYEYAEADGRVVTILTYRNGILQRKEDINRKDENGLAQGLWKEFYPNERVKWEGYYVDGKRDGIFKEFNNRGDLKDMTKYDDDLVQENAPEAAILDIRSTYYSDGTVASTGSFTPGGKKEGMFREFEKDGTIRSAKIYRNDMMLGKGETDARGAMQGHWKEFHPSGELRAEGEYKDGGRNGDWIFYFRNGEVEQKGKYQDGKPHGLWRWYFMDGSPHREETYRKGREDGASVEYNMNAEVITEGEYIDGLKDGPWMYKVGDHTERGEYRDGLKQGEWEHTYDNGKRNFIGDFVQGEPDGKHKYYYPNGQLRLEGRYQAGSENGEWVKYASDGQVVMRVKYKRGAEVRIDDIPMPPPYEPGEAIP